MKLNDDSFLINGVFFSENTTGPGVHGNNFSGVIMSFGKVHGKLEDLFGSSLVYNFKKTNDKLSFGKQYANEQDRIFYRFFWNEGQKFWIGYWRRQNHRDRGLATCVLLPYPDSFNNPIFVIEALRLKGFRNSQIPLIKRFSLSDILLKLAQQK